MNLFYFILFTNFSIIYAWGVDEMQIFDLVEEVNNNFYDVLGVKKDASAHEIRKAFRTLSISLHPDKSKEVDANEQFRKLVAIYEILKDSEKRKTYDNVLENGLPDWKSALYYYRRVRKMSLVEGSLVLFVIFSICQYFYFWACYWENKYMEQVILKRTTKKRNKIEKPNENDEFPSKDVTPSLFNTVIFQLPLFVFSLPTFIKNGFLQYMEICRDIKRRNKEEEERKLLNVQVLENKQKLKELRKKKVKEIQRQPFPESSFYETSTLNMRKNSSVDKSDYVKPVNVVPKVSGGFWTDNDISHLINLVNKYPAGVQGRWQIIAEIMNRSVNEITYMVQKLKNKSFSNLNEDDSSSNILNNNKTEYSNQMDQLWTQQQQKALEEGLITFQLHTDKWDKIADYVGKSKQDCIKRYKYLVQLVKSNNTSKCINNISDNLESRTDKTALQNETNEAPSPQEFQKIGKKQNVRKLKKKDIDDVCSENYSDL